jgi:hypothetical protein
MELQPRHRRPYHNGFAVPSPFFPVENTGFT